MVTNHLQSNSTKAMLPHGGKRRSQKSEKKSDSFDDMLSKSVKSNRKKKTTSKVAAQRPIVKKKEADVADNEQVQQRVQKPIAKKPQGQEQPKQPTQAVQAQQKANPELQGMQQAQVGKSVDPQKQLLQAEQEQLLQMKIAEKQTGKDVALFENQDILKEAKVEKKQGIPLSKDSSETLEKTLTANEKKLVQDLNTKQLQRETNIFQPNAQAKKLEAIQAMKPSDLKIEPKPANPSNQNSELIENLESLKSKLSDLAKSDKNLSQDSNTGLDSGLAQPMDGEVSVDQVDKSFFAEKLAEIDGTSQKSEKIENMNSIIKQARAFIKDGGGEMQIELAPEGLGKIQLKVAVENGKAQVEMFADNKMAKAALEDSLAEMKLGLESQRLIVEHLKVEMSNDYERDFSQLKDNLMEQEQREFARQFLNQFRDEKNERWDGMFSGFKNYARTGEKPELSLSPGVQQRAMAQGKGRSLNVVA